MPAVDREANERKDRIDSLAADLLNIDPRPRLKAAKTIEAALSGLVRLAITGGAGSGKSSIACDVAEDLDLPVFDFDEYIKGGYTKDSKEYKKRLLNGMNTLLDDLPHKGGWIIEHVEACSEDVVKAFKPTYALLICPPAEKMLRTAAARSTVSNESEKMQYSREQRALESAEYARLQFEKVPGEVFLKDKGWRLKKVS